MYDDHHDDDHVIEISYHNVSVDRGMNKPLRLAPLSSHFHFRDHTIQRVGITTAFDFYCGHFD